MRRERAGATVAEGAVATSVQWCTICVPLVIPVKEMQKQGQPLVYGGQPLEMQKQGQLQEEGHWRNKQGKPQVTCQVSLPQSNCPPFLILELPLLRTTSSGHILWQRVAQISRLNELLCQHDKGLLRLCSQEWEPLERKLLNAVTREGAFVTTCSLKPAEMPTYSSGGLLLQQWSWAS